MAFAGHSFFLGGRTSGVESAPDSRDLWENTLTVASQNSDIGDGTDSDKDAVLGWVYSLSHCYGNKFRPKGFLSKMLIVRSFSA